MHQCAPRARLRTRAVALVCKNGSMFHMNDQAPQFKARSHHYGLGLKSRGGIYQHKRATDVVFADHRSVARETPRVRATFRHEWHSR